MVNKYIPGFHPHIFIRRSAKILHDTLNYCPCTRPVLAKEPNFKVPCLPLPLRFGAAPFPFPATLGAVPHPFPRESAEPLGT